MKHRGKTYIILVLITIGCKIIGFLRESTLAYFFGANDYVDAFKMVWNLSGVLLGWLIAYSVVFVPVFSEIRSQSGEKQAGKYMRQLFWFTSLIALAFVTLALLTTRQVVAVGALGFSEEKKRITEDMYRIGVLSYLIYPQVTICCAYLNCNKKFISAGAAALLISIIEILFIILAYQLKQPIIMAVGLPASVLGEYIYVRFASRISETSLLREIRIFPLSQELKTTAKMSLPLFVSEIVYYLNDLIDNTFASGLPEGSVALLSYANLISSSFYTLVTSSILTVFYTSISAKIAEKDRPGEVSELSGTLRLLMNVLVPFALFAVLFSRWGVNIIYERGAFGANEAEKTALAFSIYILAIPAISFRNLTTKYFQANKKTHIPLILTVINIIINIILNFILIRLFGIFGLAAATTLSYYALIPVEVLLIRKICREIRFREEIKRIGLLSVVTLATVIPFYFIIRLVHLFYMDQIFPVRIIMLILFFCISAGIFLILAHLFKLFDIHTVIGTGISWIRKKTQRGEKDPNE